MIKQYFKPFKLEFDKSIPDKLYCSYNYKQSSVDDIIFMSGSRLPKADEGQIAYSNNPDTYQLVADFDGDFKKISKYDVLPSFSIPLIVNNRVIEILKDFCGNDFQSFPIRINAKKNTSDINLEKHKFWALNITNSVEVIDTSRSDISYWDNRSEIKFINNIYFRTGLMKNGEIHIAREKFYSPLILASPQLKEAFEKHKVKGCEFLTDEEYNRLSF